CVHVAVVAAGELDHLGAPGEPARQPDGAHGGLRARVHEPDLLHGGAGDDLAGQVHLAGGGRAEAQPAGGGLADGVDDLGVRVAVDHRPPRAHEVDVGVAVDVRHTGTPRLLHEA